MKEISFKKIFTKLMYIAVFIYVVMTLVSQQKKIDSYELFNLRNLEWKRV